LRRVPRSTQRPRAPRGSIPEYIFIVQLNSVDGRDDEFNAWYYSDAHLPEAVKVQVFASSAQPNKVCSFSLLYSSNPYQLTIYEMDGEEPQAALAALTAAVPSMNFSTAQADGPMVHVFESVGEPVVYPVESLSSRHVGLPVACRHVQTLLLSRGSSCTAQVDGCRRWPST
jgi:hypothetical protein